MKFQDHIDYINSTSLVGSLKQFLTAQSKAIRTAPLPEVRAVVETVDADLDSVKDYKSNIIDWLRPVVDLSGYRVYPMSGITQGLDWWYNRETGGVTVDQGEYQWISPRAGSYPKWHYLSVPSAIDGDFCDVPRQGLVALDLAYVGSTAIKRIEHDADVVFYSLSKSFGLRNIRTGWMFTRKPDAKLDELIYGAKYYNYYATQVAERVINSFDIDYVHTRLYPQQKHFCELLDFAPSDAVWLATTTQDEFSEWRRRGNVARICLAGLYNYEKA